MLHTNYRIGILGGGQLGRMLIQEAINWDLDISILDPNPQAPCAHIANTFVEGDLEDFETVYQFGKDLDIISIEIEKVNVDALEKLEQEGKLVYPQPSVIRIIQDKRLQKQFYEAHQIPSADFILIDQKSDIEKHADFLPAFQKLGRGGYDGRGVQNLNSLADLDQAFDAPSLLEKKVEIDKEIAIIIARNAQGETEVFPAIELVFNPEQNLVDYLFAPAQITTELEKQAQEIAQKVMNTLGMVGILAIEMFLDTSGNLLVNEAAPRPHNSGHHSIEGNICSQFEQHLRAILNFPLGDTSTLSPAAMVNLLGEPEGTGKATYEGLDEVLQIPGIFVHLYGKKVTKPFRKMGHVTLLGEDLKVLQNKIALVKKHLKVKPA